MEAIIGALYIAGTVRAAITTRNELKKFTAWVKRRNERKRMNREEWILIETCNDEFVVIEHNTI